MADGVSGSQLAVITAGPRAPGDLPGALVVSAGTPGAARATVLG